MTVYKKLVRDNIPDIIKSDGKSPTTHIASDEEYGKALVDKLREEVDEFRASGEIEELVDILEVIDAICKFRGIDKDKLQQVRQDKVQQRGSFSKRIILDRVK